MLFRSWLGVPAFAPVFDPTGAEPLSTGDPMLVGELPAPVVEVAFCPVPKEPDCFAWENSHHRASAITTRTPSAMSMVYSVFLFMVVYCCCADRSTLHSTPGSSLVKSIPSLLKA